jgi:hypothetical protein
MKDEGQGRMCIVAQWEYCQISNPQSGTDAVVFSRPQPRIVEQYSTALGRGLKAEHSGPQFLHLNLNHVNAVSVAGTLGFQGWELVSHAVLTGGHEYWTFKRLLQEKAASLRRVTNLTVAQELIVDSVQEVTGSRLVSPTPIRIAG